MELEPYQPGAVAVRTDPAFARDVGAALDLLRSVVGPVCNEEARSALAARCVYWRDRNGLTAEDVRRACRYLSRPDVLARCRFPSDLAAEFAAGVGRAIGERTRAAEAAKLRGEDAEAAAGAARGDEVRAMIGGLLESWGER